MTAPIDAETLCFLDVVAYVRADSDASDDCREAVRDAYPGNTGAPVREAICHMTDYVRPSAIDCDAKLVLHHPCLSASDFHLPTDLKAFCADRTAAIASSMTQHRT